MHTLAALERSGGCTRGGGHDGRQQLRRVGREALARPCMHRCEIARSVVSRAARAFCRSASSTGSSWSPRRRPGGGGWRRGGRGRGEEQARACGSAEEDAPKRDELVGDGPALRRGGGGARQRRARRASRGAADLFLTCRYGCVTQPRISSPRSSRRSSGRPFQPSSTTIGARKRRWLAWMSERSASDSASASASPVVVVPPAPAAASPEAVPLIDCSASSTRSVASHPTRRGSRLKQQ